MTDKITNWVETVVAHPKYYQININDQIEKRSEGEKDRVCSMEN
jgi:hypothetical protein